MPDDFRRAFDLVVSHEGGYVNDPHDPGGETKFGISKRAYPDLDIRALTLEDAERIYRRDYWDASGADRQPWPLSLVVFDCAVNQGVSVAEDILSRATTPEYYLAERAVRYAGTRNFDRYGRGWMRRLFSLATYGS